MLFRQCAVLIPLFLLLFWALKFVSDVDYLMQSIIFTSKNFRYTSYSCILLAGQASLFYLPCYHSFEFLEKVLLLFCFIHRALRRTGLFIRSKMKMIILLVSSIVVDNYIWCSLFFPGLATNHSIYNDNQFNL